MKAPASWITRVLRELKVISDSIDNQPIRLGLIELPLASLKGVQRAGYITLGHGYVTITDKGLAAIKQKQPGTSDTEEVEEEIEE